ncbi:MAG: glycoside hydrolase family 13 protein [Oscillospiraceae bacterium]|nr:glycoside hydrolase family 13 protein [Oscillospiraceae bacterium]
MGNPVFDSRKEEHKRPFGAVASGQSVAFRIVWESRPPVWFVLRRDETGEEERHEMSRGKKATEWTFEHTFDEVGLYFYRFTQGPLCVSRKSPDSAGIVCDGEEGDWYVQLVYDSEYRQPEAFCGRIIYQIFPDRFYHESVNETGFADRTIHADLDAIPNFRPVDGVVMNNDFFGGNFQGIIKKLPYLRELGVGVIYLNPVFESHSNHRYDTADYLKIDPLLGTNEDFRLLCETARANNILIILDGVFSHTGADSVYFDKFKRYGGKTGAFDNPDSPYRSWYHFDDSKVGYRSWWGFPTLPDVDEDDPGYREFICGEGGVIDSWLSLGASGFRLDVADELPDSFIRQLRKTIKRHGDDKLLLGEVWEDAATKTAYDIRRRYLWGDELDSVMNYPFREAILDFVRNADSVRFMRRVMEIVENYPKPMMDVMMNLLSTHDTERLLTALVSSGSGDREWQVKQSLKRDDYLRGVEMAKLAFSLLFTLPGLPCVYYGDEIGMQGHRDPFNRGYFRWEDIDDNLRDYVITLSLKRRTCSAFKDGVIIPVSDSGGCVCYLRQNSDNTVLIMVNRSVITQNVTVGGVVYTAKPWKSFVGEIGDFDRNG